MNGPGNALSQRRTKLTKQTGEEALTLWEQAQNERRASSFEALKVHLLKNWGTKPIKGWKPQPLCNMPNTWRHTTNPAEVTCANCRKMIGA